jgi:Flp pilus assembly protein TadG
MTGHRLALAAHGAQARRPTAQRVRGNADHGPGRPPQSIPGTAGQASVELVAALPVVLVVALAAFAVISAHAAAEQAGEAAEAGAVAILQDHDPRAAARAALPAAVRPRAQIVIAGTRVHVQVRPRLPLPGLGDRLAGSADADAGPGAATPPHRRGGSRR